MVAVLCSLSQSAGGSLIESLIESLYINVHLVPQSRQPAVKWWWRWLRSLSQAVVVPATPGPVLVAGGHGDAPLARALHHVVDLVQHPVHRQLVHLHTDSLRHYLHTDSLRHYLHTDTHSLRHYLHTDTQTA